MQSITCLAADTCLTADPGVTGLIPAWSHTFKEIDHEIFSGAQWLSGSVLDSRPKGRGFEPHRRHCIVVLEQDTFILA